MDKKAGASRVFEHLLAGVAGGVASTLVLHPLDLVKIRFQGIWRKISYFTSFKGNVSTRVEFSRLEKGPKWVNSDQIGPCR